MSSNRFHRGEWRVGVALATLLLAGCGGPRTTEAAKNPSPSPAGGAVPTVNVVTAIERPVSASVQATGSFVAKESSDVAPLTGGRIDQTPVDVGAFVKEGQVIARMEGRDAQLRLDQSKANYEQSEASVRQSQSRIGLDSGGQFNANNVPEVLSAKAAFESATAQAHQAEADAQRYANLIKTGDVSQSAYEKARTQADTAGAQVNSAKQQYEATLNSARQNYQGVMTAQASLSGAKAQLAIAQKGVEDTIIHAPFSGYVSARPIAVGQFVGTNAKIATVLRITPIRLELQVPEANAPQMKLADPVDATVPGYPKRVFEGRVAAINPAVDTSSRAITVIAEFPNADLALKPGMFATARIHLPGSTKGIFVPRAAVTTDPTTNSSQLFFVRDERARVAVVQLGVQSGLDTEAAAGGMVQILSGINAGSAIATDHLADLYDGMPVKSNQVQGKER